MAVKGKILAVGSFGDDGWPTYWMFDGAEIGLKFTPDGPLLAGYTIAELREIAGLAPMSTEQVRSLAVVYQERMQGLNRLRFGEPVR